MVFDKQTLWGCYRCGSHDGTYDVPCHLYFDKEKGWTDQDTTLVMICEECYLNWSNGCSLKT